MASYEASLAVHRDVGNRRDEGHVLTNLAILDNQHERLVEAKAHFEAALAEARAAVSSP